MKTTDSRDPTLHWELFIRQRGSATQGVPPGKEALTWVANTVTLIWGERDALLVDTFLGDAQTTELADWIEAKGRTLRTIYLTHGHPDHFLAPIRQRPHIADLKMSAPNKRNGPNEATSLARKLSLSPIRACPLTDCPSRKGEPSVTAEVFASPRMLPCAERPCAHFSPRMWLLQCGRTAILSSSSE
jgi:hypothetical protein